MTPTGDEMAERGTDRWIVAELRAQLEEALSIIEDFTNEYGASMRTWERIEVLGLAQ